MSARIIPIPKDEGSAEYKACLQFLRTGVAVVDTRSWSIVFENARFQRWFPPPADGGDTKSLLGRIGDLDVQRAHGLLAKGRSYRLEREVRRGARSSILLVELHQATIFGTDFVLVECQDISKQKESEYLLDSYSRMAEKNARELTREKERAEKLLLNVMPRSVYEEMKDSGTTTPQRFESASVLMLGFVGFTSMAVSREPSALVAELNDIFSSFDQIVDLFGCERIKTIGDGYVAVSGLPQDNPDHTIDIARVALRMRRYLERRNAASSHQWRARIGIGSGPLIGSLIGTQKYVYDILGPAVNLAAHLETFCEPMKISVCQDTARLIERHFALTEQDKVGIKGFETGCIYTLENELRR